LFITSYAASQLPPGLNIDPVSGLISGTPTAVGVTNIALTITDATGATQSKTLTLTINPAPPVVMNPGNLSGETGQPFTYSIAASNSPISFTALGLPAGLSIDNTGLISGTPTSAGSSNVTVTATNASGSGIPVNFTITVSGCVVN